MTPSFVTVSMRKPTRVGFLVSGSTSATFETWIGASCGLDATGLRAALGLADADVLGDEVDALDDDAVLLDLHLDDATLLAAVAAASLARAGDDLDEVTLLDVFAMT